MPPQDQTPDKKAPAPNAGAPIDPKSFLLPKKDGAPSVDSAERTDASALIKQEEAASKEGTAAQAPQPQAPHTIATPVGFGGFPKGQTPAGVVPTSTTIPAQKPSAEAPKIGDLSTPAVPPPPKKEESVVKAIETYGTDINRVVAQGDVSVVSIAAAEAERRARAAAGEPIAPQDIAPQAPESPMRPVLLIAGAIFIVAAAGIVAALFLHTANTAPQSAQAPQAPFLNVDQTVAIPVKSVDTHDSIITKLEAARQQDTLSLGLVERLYMAAGTTSGALPDQAPAQEFMQLLAPDMPADLLRTIEPTYLVGVHSYDENQAFIVLQVDSYQQAYAGMLAWEDFMRQDLLPFFTRHPAAQIQNSDASSTSTTTASTTQSQEVINTGFVDRVVANHDARVYLDSQGNILMLWTFLDRNTLVITTNESTLTEVIRRINTTSLVPQPK